MRQKRDEWGTHFCAWATRLGAFGRKFAGVRSASGSICTDLAGHTTVEITIEADYARSEVAETATVIAKFEPAALDEFLKELPELEHRLSGGTTLSIL
jgi:hypothetical protein